MKRSGVLSALLLGGLFQAAAAQELIEPERVFSDPEGVSVVRELSPTQEFIDRMERAEARIAELEARNRELSGESLLSEGGIQQVGYGSHLNLGAMLLGHDPEIGIIREQTASGAAENAAAESVKSVGKGEAPKKKGWY